MVKKARVHSLQSYEETIPCIGVQGGRDSRFQQEVKEVMAIEDPLEKFSFNVDDDSKGAKNYTPSI